MRSDMRTDIGDIRARMAEQAQISVGPPTSTHIVVPAETITRLLEVSNDRCRPLTWLTHYLQLSFRILIPCATMEDSNSDIDQGDTHSIAVTTRRTDNPIHRWTILKVCS
jgi:hypothetical protein